MNSYKRKLIREELQKAKQKNISDKVQLVRANISEAKTNINKNLLVEYYADAQRKIPVSDTNETYVPWTGTVSQKNEEIIKKFCWPGAELEEYRKDPTLIIDKYRNKKSIYKNIIRFGGWWAPAALTKKSVWEMDVHVHTIVLDYYHNTEKPQEKQEKPKIITKPKKGSDRLWFYEDGVVHSVNSLRKLGYEHGKDELGNDIITLYKHKNGPQSKSSLAHFWENQEIAGKIFTKGGRPILQLAKDTEKAKKPKKEHKVLDWLNLILDFAGFIPGIGDALDLVNGCIYWYRCTVLDEDMWLDVLFSCIAAIPLVGSFIAVAAKTAYRSRKSAKLGLALRGLFAGRKGLDKTYHAEKIWERLLDDGVITPHQMQMLAKKEYVKKLGNILRRSKKPVSDVIGTAHVKLFDDFANKLDSLGKGLDDVYKQGKESGKVVGDLKPDFLKAKVAGKGANTSKKGLTYIAKQERGIVKRLFKKLKGIPGYPVKEVKRMEKMMEQGFRKTMKSSPDKLAILSRSMGSNPAMYKSMGNMMQSLQKSLNKAGPKELADFQKKLVKNLKRSSEINPGKLKQVKQTKTSMVRDIFGSSSAGKQKQYTKTMDDIPYGGGDEFSKAQKGKNKFSKRDVLTDAEANEMANNMLGIGGDAQKNWWRTQMSGAPTGHTPVTAEQFNSIFKTFDESGKYKRATDAEVAIKTHYDKMGSMITSKAHKGDNVMWNMYKMNGTANLRTMFYVGDDFTKAVKDLGRLKISPVFKNLNTRTVKWADIIYNEHKDLREKLGWEDHDDVDAAIIPLMKMAIWDNLSKDSKKDIKGVFDFSKGFGELFGKSAQVGAQFVSDMVGGPDLKSFQDYTPDEEEGGKYGDLADTESMLDRNIDKELEI